MANQLKFLAVISVAATCMIVAGPLLSAEMPALAKKDTCTDCHAIDKRIVGPARMDVSKRYRGAAEYEYKGKKIP